MRAEKRKKKGKKRRKKKKKKKKEASALQERVGEKKGTAATLVEWEEKGEETGDYPPS